MDQQVQAETKDKPSPPTLERPVNKGESWSEEARATGLAYALERMTDGDSLEQACRELDVNPGTVWGWIAGNPEAVVVYESSKIARSRGFIERAIDAIQTNPDYKAGESLARSYMRLAALLNPKEFSDKVHAIGHKQGPQGRVSFNLTFNGRQPHDMGELTVIAQPEGDSEG